MKYESWSILNQKFFKQLRVIILNLYFTYKILKHTLNFYVDGFVIKYKHKYVKFILAIGPRKGQVE